MFGIATGPMTESLTGKLTYNKSSVLLKNSPDCIAIYLAEQLNLTTHHDH